MAPFHRFALLVPWLFASAPLVADDTERDSLFSPDELFESEGMPSKDQLAKVNDLYLRDVKPIFEKKCLACHGPASDAKLPWYYPIPGAEQLIDRDIAEAKKHVDMSNDFPFGGHGKPKEDLKAIKETIEKGDMPPFRYWVMHWGSAVNSDDKAKILRWIAESLAVLTEGNGDTGEKP